MTQQQRMVGNKFQHTTAIVEIRAREEKYKKACDEQGRCTPVDEPSLLMKSHALSHWNGIAVDLSDRDDARKGANNKRDAGRCGIIYIRNFKRECDLRTIWTPPNIRKRQRLVRMDKLFEREKEHNEWWPLQFSMRHGYEWQRFSLYYAGRMFNDGTRLSMSQARQLDASILRKIGMYYVQFISVLCTG